MKGFKIHTRPDRSSQDCNVIYEVIYHDCYRLKLLSTIIQPKVILDVGGHIGTFGILAKKYWPDAKLIALEPNKISWELYCKNIEENHKGTEGNVLNGAIGYDKDKMILMDGYKATGGGMMMDRERAEQLSKGGKYRIFDEHVNSLTLENLMKMYEVEKFDLIKWDCEGGERDSFKYMEDSTAQSLSYMVGEYHIQGGAPAITQLIEGRCPHLKVVAKPRGGHIGPFWVFPKDKVLNV
jgi:FkbM family methyltransferase